MEMIKYPNRTSAYQFSLIGDYSDLENCLTLKALKESLKGSGKYVQLKGRKPKTKMMVKSYWHSPKLLGYDFGGNVVGGLKNATKFDVYVRNY